MRRTAGSGFATIWLILGHVAATTLGYTLGDDRRVLDRARRPPDDVPVGDVGARRARLLALVGVTSFRFARRRLATRRGSASTCTPTWPSPWPSRTSWWSGRTSSTTRWPVVYWIAMYGVAIGLVLLPSGWASPLAMTLRHRFDGRQRRAGGARRRVDLRHRPRSRSAGGPRRPVLQPPAADPRRVVPRAPVLAVRRAERAVPALHGQGPRRLEPALPAHCDSAHGSCSRVRTAS